MAPNSSERATSALEAVYERLSAQATTRTKGSEVSLAGTAMADLGGASAVDGQH